MKRLTNKRKIFLVKRQEKIEKNKKKRKIRRGEIKKRKAPRSKLTRFQRDLLLQRRRLNFTLYSRISPVEGVREVLIEGELGIESKEKVKYFIEKASEAIDFREQGLLINLKKCTRVWPTGVTLFCSLLQWVESCTSKLDTPRVRSTPSDSEAVNSYLEHCGFYGYVNRKADGAPKIFQDKDKDIVKIRREKNNKIDGRENEIIELLKRYSSLDNNEIEEFLDVVLIETFNNVTEHGLGYKDTGWWILAQHHPTSKIISVCIADNGIGFKNNMLTGPQKEDIESRLKGNLEEGDIIRLALNEHVSGAITATQREPRPFGSKRHPRGSKRGNGLKRIRDTCKKLQVRFSILSHHGYLLLGENGEEEACGTIGARVFAGTLYHFTIKTAGE